ncbi:MAG: sodium-dependent transporter [Bacilli bacterium]
MEQKKKKADGFNSRWGFILAAMGSAIGLGNIWRYPVMAYSNGGGAFLIPYVVALLTAGIPFLIFEFNLGNKFRSSAPGVFRKLHPKLEFIGWLQTIITIIVPIFYSVVIGWIIYYLFQSFTLAWGSDTTTSFYTDFLKMSDMPASPFEIGMFNPLIVGLIILVWVVTAAISVKGISKGVEKVNKVMVPTLLVMYALVVIYSLTLDGAVTGLQQFFAPQWSKLSDPSIWLAAYGQVFFSTSIASGIMITYAAYTDRKADINSNAVITGLGNASVELAAGFGVFAALGFLALQSGKSVDEVVMGGPGLVFDVYPAVLNQLPPVIGPIVGVVFYTSLVFAGISSLISLVEVAVAALSEKFNINRKAMVITICSVLGCLSLLIATPAGLYLLDILDHFVNVYIWQIAGFLESFVVVVFLIVSKQLIDVLGYGNTYSTFKVNPKLLATILMITGCLLVYFVVNGFLLDIDPKTTYEGYPSYMMNVWGWGSVGIGAIIVLILSVLPSKNSFDELKE